MTYRITQTLDEGIEHIVYTPEQRRFETPLLMQHGMWHGAWCWKKWQEFFAEMGWESHSFSLPGHGKSLPGRHHRWCTLQYYYGFLAAEISRMKRPPAVLGHSMGGALIQRHLKHADLPAAVLVASWPSRSLMPTLLYSCFHIPVSVLLGFATFSASPVIRTPRAAADYFLTEGAVLGREEFHARLSAESLFVVLQYQPPFWRPPLGTKTPLLWVAGTRDGVIPERTQRASAREYGCEYHTVPGDGHDLMLEKSFRSTAEIIRAWLVKQGIA
jgi:pimeloyl-ACP methyl ester carboxylesterase